VFLFENYFFLEANEFAHTRGGSEDV